MLIVYTLVLRTSNPGRRDETTAVLSDRIFLSSLFDSIVISNLTHCAVRGILSKKGTRVSHFASAAGSGSYEKTNQEEMFMAGEKEMRKGLKLTSMSHGGG